MESQTSKKEQTSICLLMITECLVFLNQHHLMVSSRHFLNGQKKSLRISQSQTITSSFLSCQLQQPQKTSSRKMSCSRGSCPENVENIDRITAQRVKKEQDKAKAISENKPQDAQDITKEIKDIQEEIDKLNSKLEQKKFSPTQSGFLSQVHSPACNLG